MNILNDLVNRLTPYVKDVVPISELEIRQFSIEHGVYFRDDHLQFLMRFGTVPGERPSIFKWYGGDFHFHALKAEYLDTQFDMELPTGTTYFGADFVGTTFCIVHDTGEIFAYDEGEKYGLVHETLDGFLLRCMVSVYIDEAFANKVTRLDLDPVLIDEFRQTHAKNRIVGSTAYAIEYMPEGLPPIIAEYYLTDQAMVLVYPTTNSMVELRGGILENIHP